MPASLDIEAIRRDFPILARTVRGKPLFIYYSYDKRDADASFPRFITAARWGRIGEGIR